MTISDGHVVEMNYVLTSTDGQTLDSSEGKAPLAFIIGKQNIIPGLEKEIVGKSQGDSFSVTVAPEEAYGERNEAMVQSVPKSEFGTDIDQIEVGTQFQLQDQSGRGLIATAVEIKEEEIVLDANHPLAGETLNFAVEIVGVRSASDEELSAGRVAAEESCCDSNSGCCD